MGDLIYHFGPFRLDGAEGLLLRGDESVPLTRKAFETLLALIQNHGRTVSKEELLARVWPDTHVEESTLAQNIFTLRKVLGQTPDGRSYIENVPRRGYRFAVKVNETPSIGVALDPEAPTAPATVSGAKRVKHYMEGTESLAVLPFYNETDDSNAEYLARGITESIINSLSLLTQIRVMACSTIYFCKYQDQPPQDVGRMLGVRVVLVGKIFQAQDRLIIRTELVEVESGWQIWGEQYDRKVSDILILQDEIASAISEKLRLKLTKEQHRRLTTHKTENADSYQLYLKGRYNWNKQTEEGYEKSIEYYEQAIEADPGFALAYSGLTDSYVLLDFYGIRPPNEMMPKARAAALKALEIDDTLAEAHTSLACVKLVHDWDWLGAEREFKHAVALNPKYPHAHHWYSHFLLAMGRFEESYRESQIALDLDPLDPGSNLHLGWYYLYTRQYEQAIKQFQWTLEIDPHFWPPHTLLGETYGQRGMYEEAIRQIEHTRQVKERPLTLGYLGHAYAISNQTDQARELLGELKDQSKSNYVPPYGIALIYTGLGDKDNAFEWLDKAADARNEWMGWLKVNPEFDSLRADQRFTTLLRRIGLPS